MEERAHVLPHPVEVKANVRIVGCAIHHFPSDKDDPRLSVGRFLVAVFGGAKMPFSQGNDFFFCR